MDISRHNCGHLAQPGGEPQDEGAPGETTALSAAETLACALTDAPELQEYLRLARTVRLDPQVIALTNRINGDPCGEDLPSLPASREALIQRLEALPVVQAYIQAEEALRALLSAVDAEISSSAGVPFALHAKPDACG